MDTLILPTNAENSILSSEETACFTATQKKHMFSKVAGRPLRLLSEDDPDSYTRAIFVTSWRCKTPDLCDFSDGCSSQECREQ